jgi:hypothetical protein
MSQPTPVIISATMIKDHLSQLTDAWFASHDMPPSNVEAYADYADRVIQLAQASGDLDWFVLGLQHLLARPDIETSTFGDDSFSYTDQQMADILRFVLSRKGASPNAAAAHAVQLQEMSDAQWEAMRKALK